MTGPTIKRRVFQIERLGARQVFVARMVAETNVELHQWIYEMIARLVREIENCASKEKHSIVGPVKVDLVFEAGAEAIDDEAGLSETQRWDAYHSGLREVVIEQYDPESL